ncbi:MAG: hypothetical protein V3V72_00060 [Ignavibacteriaceae bacterium]
MKTMKIKRAVQKISMFLILLTFTFIGCENSTEVQPNGLSVKIGGPCATISDVNIK